MATPDPLNPSSSPERREQAEAFLKWWAKGAAVNIYGSSWYDIGLAAWLAACDYAERWIPIAEPPTPEREGKSISASVLVIDRDGESCVAYYSTVSGWYERGEKLDINELVAWRAIPRL